MSRYRSISGLRALWANIVCLPGGQTEPDVQNELASLAGGHECASEPLLASFDPRGESQQTKVFGMKRNETGFWNLCKLL